VLVVCYEGYVPQQMISPRCGVRPAGAAEASRALQSTKGGTRPYPPDGSMHTPIVASFPLAGAFGLRGARICVVGALASEKKMIWYRSTTTYRVEVL
jgi:hypothetical protein